MPRSRTWRGSCHRRRRRPSSSCRRRGGRRRILYALPAALGPTAGRPWPAALSPRQASARLEGPAAGRRCTQCGVFGSSFPTCIFQAVSCTCLPTGLSDVEVKPCLCRQREICSGQHLQHHPGRKTLRKTTRTTTCLLLASGPLPPTLCPMARAAELSFMIHVAKVLNVPGPVPGQHCPCSRAVRTCCA